MWLEEEGCRETVEEEWSREAQAHAMVRVESKIEYCQSKLKGWHRVARQMMQLLVGSPWVGCFG